MAATIEPTGYGMDKLNSEIFSLLESKFLFGNQNNNNMNFSTAVTPTWRGSSSPFTTDASNGGRIRILSIDAGGATEGLLAAASLALLESSLQHITSDTCVRIPDFFDLAAGSGVGGVLVSLIFARDTTSSRPLLSAAQVLRIFSKHRHSITHGSSFKKGGVFRKIFGRERKNKKTPPSDSVFRRLFGDDLTLKDTVKPVLIPCYDLATGAPFVFSRADAMETTAYDFRIREVCAATMGMKEAKNVKSVDGRTRISAASVDGGVAMGNPASTAITHVLNNKIEFPFASDVQDLFLVSIGNGEAASSVHHPGNNTPSHAGIVKIAGDGVSDMIDQAVGMAFGQSRANNYIRIQGREPKPCSNSNARESKDESSSDRLLGVAEEMLAQKNIESVLFQGKKLSEKTNGEKLDWAAVELVKENDRRKKSPLPIVVFKESSPRRYSCSSSSAISSSSNSSP